MKLSHAVITFKFNPNKDMQFYGVLNMLYRMTLVRECRIGFILYFLRADVATPKALGLLRESQLAHDGHRKLRELAVLYG